MDIRGVLLFFFLWFLLFLVVIFSPNLIDDLGRGARMYNLHILISYFIWFVTGIFLKRNNLSLKLAGFFGLCLG